LVWDEIILTNSNWSASGCEMEERVDHMLWVVHFLGSIWSLLQQWFDIHLANLQYLSNHLIQFENLGSFF